MLINGFVYLHFVYIQENYNGGINAWGIQPKDFLLT